IGKLQLSPDSVVYDIGAGTGSVSIEIAQGAPDIQVYAIEKNEEALELLEKNKQKFAADNIEIIGGLAPTVLENLPVPTHAFIGGSSGNMEEILQKVFEKNPECRVVVNTIALNSISKLMEILEQNKEYQFDIVQMQTSVAKKAGDYQLMMGQNPIYIVTIWKEKEHEAKDSKANDSRNE
nr:precorrin-6Y C5,15-methyltransferase (decarboxylating) subunit CbiT [Butyrivibrio sp.]